MVGPHFNQATLTFLNSCSQSFSSQPSSTSMSLAFFSALVPGNSRPQSSKFLRWNAAADNLEYVDILSSGGIGVPVAIAEGGTSATTAASARTNLGLGAAARFRSRSSG